MLRPPQIMQLAPFNQMSGCQRFIALFETHGAGGPNTAGQIYRCDVTIPEDKTNDGVYIAEAMASAWKKIALNARAQHCAKAGGDFEECSCRMSVGILKPKDSGGAPSVPPTLGTPKMTLKEHIRNLFGGSST